MTKKSTVNKVYGKQRGLFSDWLICYPGSQTLTERALPKSSKTKMTSERAISSLTLLHRLEPCPLFPNGRKMQGGKAQTFHRLRFSLLLASNCFPRGFLKLVGSWKNVPHQVQNTRSNTSYVKFKQGVVCRKCCCNLINQSARVLW